LEFIRKLENSVERPNRSIRQRLLEEQMTNEAPQAKWQLQGGNLPAVNPADLKKVWQASADFEAHHPGQSGISDTFYQRVCSPGADIVSAWYRASMLVVLKEMMPELFESWTHDTELDDVVLEVAATFPMEKLKKVSLERDLRLM
jgi:hypothetical protein